MNKKVRRKSLKPPGKCVFCEDGAVPGNPMTGEHLWSNWMSEFLPTLTDPEYVEVAATFTQKTVMTNKFERTRQGHTNTKTIKVVCKTCNSGWMSGLESAVQPYLVPLILGAPVRLDTDAKQILARWIVLKILVAENNSYREFSADPIFGQASREAFRVSLQIPDGIRIWLAFLRGSKWSTGFFRHTAGLSPPPLDPKQVGTKNVQTTTFGLGKLLIHSSSTVHAPLYSILELEGISPPFEALWPLTTNEIVWPPRFFVGDADADQVAGALETLIISPHVRWVPS
jgi:hypothetical protein